MAVSDIRGAAPSTGPATTVNTWAWVALAIAAVGLTGSLLLSLGLHLRACPFCFYQRTFVMAAFAVLGVGLLTDRARAGFLCLLSVPLAFGGLGVAAFHEYLVLAGKLECPAGFFGLGTAPAQSLAVFVLLATVTVVGAWLGGWDQPARRTGVVLASVVLGLLLAWGSVASSPPAKKPDKPYDPATEPLNICRPPFHP